MKRTLGKYLGNSLVRSHIVTDLEEYHAVLGGIRPLAPIMLLLNFKASFATEISNWSVVLFTLALDQHTLRPNALYKEIVREQAATHTHEVTERCLLFVGVTGFIEVLTNMRLRHGTMKTTA